VHRSDANEWNCAMDSYPLENQHDEYESVQEFFRIQLIEPAMLDTGDFPDNVDLTDGQEIELKVVIANFNAAFPKPQFVWTLDGVTINLDDDKKESDNGITVTYRYACICNLIAWLRYCSVARLRYCCVARLRDC
jgi:hypothetical protein